jgi:hypothetical protein
MTRQVSALLDTCIFGPILYHTTVNTDVYLDNSPEYANQLDGRKLTFRNFQQDGGCVRRLTRAWQKRNIFFGGGV